MCEKCQQFLLASLKVKSVQKVADLDSRWNFKAYVYRSVLGLTRMELSKGIS